MKPYGKILLIALLLPSIALARLSQSKLTADKLKQMGWTVQVDKTDAQVSFTIRVADGTTNFPASTTAHLHVRDADGNILSSSTLGLQLVEKKNCLLFSVSPACLKHSRFMMFNRSTPAGRGLQVSCSPQELIEMSKTTQKQTPGSFTNLGVAIQFITESLDQDAYTKLSEACVGGHKPNAVYLSQHRRPFDMLKAAHKKQSLLDRYDTREFHKTGDKFKLGGHMSELGCLHVDFVKTDGRWFLGDIWDCK